MLMLLFLIWAALWQNQQNGMCAQRRLRSAWASVQSDQSSLFAWRKLGSLATHWAHGEDSDQTGRIIRPVWSESLLGARPHCWFCHEGGSFSVCSSPELSTETSQYLVQWSTCSREIELVLQITFGCYGYSGLSCDVCHVFNSAKISGLYVRRIGFRVMKCTRLRILLKWANKMKPTKWHVRPAKTQTSLGTRSSLCAQWVAKDQSFLHADIEDSDQSGRMPRLFWVLLGAHFVSVVMMRSNILQLILQTLWDLLIGLQDKNNENNQRICIFYLTG